MAEDKNTSKTSNNPVDEILKKKKAGEILDEFSKTQSTGVQKETLLSCFQWSYIKDSYLVSLKTGAAVIYFFIALFLVNDGTFKDFIFYDLGIRLYLTSVFFHWITDFPGFLATEAAIFSIWPLSISFVSAIIKDKKNVKLKYCICDIMYLAVIISILSLAVLFINVDRNKKACYVETYNYYCQKHKVTNLGIPGIKIDVLKECKTGGDACDFTSVYENKEYRLKLTMCRETIDAGLLSTDFVSVNNGLFESLMEAKLAKIEASYIIERLRKFKDQVNRYQEFISRTPGDREFKEFLMDVSPAPAVLDVLVLFYYLDRKWSQPGLVLKPKLLRLVKNKLQ